MTQDVAPGRLGPARRRVLSDEVADAIRHAIVSGKLAGGERLIEDELATQLGVSRGPVREALARLGLEGLVVNERHRGASVARLSADEVDEIYSLRTALERLAAEWVCRNATADELDDLGRILDQIDVLPKPLEKVAVANLDLEFHDAVFRAAHHERLYRAWEGLRSQIFLFLIQGGALREDFDVSWRGDHEAFLAALRTRKRSQALKVVEAHVEGTYKRVLATKDNAAEA
ncbi:MAG: GntR family transcriptional regulator [Acidimicrobiaceae bacterium]|jgi:DNA-binding GntR family transcriptional regulator|nr:GntR family transcriptional regulator [Acidimicrobiaceae bacterium]